MTGHGKRLYLEDLTVSFDGFKALNQLSLYVDPRELHAPSADPQRAPDQLVVSEQVAHDPQVEGTGDVLRVLEPIFELRVARHLRRIV